MMALVIVYYNYTGENIQNIEVLWGSAKWGIKKRLGTKIYLLESYLAEFMLKVHLWGTKEF